MNINLKNKNALVCGASKGIGFAIAKQFAESGANVTIVSRSKENIENALKELPNNGEQNHSGIPADFNNPHRAIDDILGEIEDNETFHILVNNSGGPKAQELLKSRPADFYDAFNSHIIMSHLLAQNLIPKMKVLHYGRIINIISIGAKQPIDNLGVSNTIRGAMMSWSKTLANEVAEFGITVNNLLPGQTRTQRLDNLIENEANRINISHEEVIQKMVSSIPVGRLGKAEDLANIATFLASDLSSFINGISIAVDGGFLKSL